jgi:hypothetical protein
MNDLKKLKLRNWSQVVKDRKAWNDVVQKIKHPCKVAEEEGEEEGPAVKLCFILFTQYIKT